MKKYIAQRYGDGFLYHEILSFTGKRNGNEFEVLTENGLTWVDSEEIVTRLKPVICWWSGGITSAVACKIAIDLYGHHNCRVIMIDTCNEDDDTYRFKVDCSAWYGLPIETIGNVGEGKKYSSIEDVWEDFQSLNVAHGAICSSELKREVRKDFQRKNEYSFQVFGFDTSEPKRAVNIKKNYPLSMSIFPLLMYGYSKKDCINIVKDAGIKIPDAYINGYHNNNCVKTGCVQGGVGYWKKRQKDFPDSFLKMAKLEHKLTDEKGIAVTILRDQSKEAKVTGRFQVFLLPHPDYPSHKSLAEMKGREVEPLVECNGFCSDTSKDKQRTLF